jgi:hypothetical protein
LAAILDHLSRSGPAASPVPAGLEALMRRMRLPYLRKAAADVLATGHAQRWDPAEVLPALLAEEVTGRDAASRRMRHRAAPAQLNSDVTSARSGN